MALEPVVLDDLTWADFNASALARIPAASGGRWTLNAPVDPGVTLLELFAWLLEQRVYWMDQVSDPLTRALLKLLGIAAKPAQAATTVLYAVADASAEGAGSAISLPAGTEIQLANGLNPPVFTTSGPATTLFPVAATGSTRMRPPRVSLYVGGKDQSDNLAQGRPTALLAADGSDTQIMLSFTAAPPAGTLALFIELSVPAGTVPGWAPGAPTGPTGPVPLTWLCAINGTLTALQVTDGTLGLRRSGIVLLQTPTGWSAQSSPPGFAIVLRGAGTGWTFLPRVTRIVPNVVSAVHQRNPRKLDDTHIRDQVKTWRRLPGNAFVLPTDDRPALASSLSVQIQEPGDAAPQPWTRVDDFSTSGPADRHYVLDATGSQLLFGDGVTGKLPVPQHTTSIKISYQVGGGTAGNLGSALPWTTVNPPAVRLCNIVPASGGADAETLAAVRARAADLLRWTGRAILASDFETLATETPGTTVARACAAIGSHPLFPKQMIPGAITVFLVPDLPRNADGSPDYGSDDPYPAGPVADQPTRDAVLAALASARLVASEVYVEPATYRGVFIDVTVSGNPANPQALRDAVIAALQNYLDPLVGGDEHAGWPFGGPLRPSSLLRVCQQAVGSAGTVILIGIAIDDASQPVETCKDVAIAPTDLVVLEQVTMTLQRPAAGQGGLR
jgi:hypothetical protein